MTISVRCFHVLDNKPEPEYRHRTQTYMRNAKQWGYDSIETEYIGLKWYGNGNGHVTFMRPDLVEKLNRIVAAHFPFHIPQDNKETRI